MKIVYDEPLKAPIVKGAVIGYAQLNDPEGNVRKINLVAANDVERMGVWGRFVANLKYLIFGDK